MGSVSSKFKEVLEIFIIYIESAALSLHGLVCVTIITRHVVHFYQKEMFPTGASGAFQVNFNEIHDLSARPGRRWATVFW